MEFTKSIIANVGVHFILMKLILIKLSAPIFSDFSFLVATTSRMWEVGVEGYHEGEITCGRIGVGGDESC